MSRITIQIDDTGEVRIYSGSEPIGFVEDIVFTASKDERMPSLQFTFLDVTKLEGAADNRGELLDKVRRNRLLASRNPCVRVFDSGDTVPSGIPIPDLKVLKGGQ